MKMKLTILWFMLLQNTVIQSTWDVLMVNVFVGGSHQTVSRYTANLLAEHGHNVTYVSTNIPTTLHPAVVRVSLREIERVGNALLEKAVVSLGDTMSEKFETMKTLFSYCGMFYEDPNIKEMIKTRPKFDAIIVMGVIYDACALGLGQELGIDTQILHIPTPFSPQYHVTNLGLPIYKSSSYHYGTIFRSNEHVKSSAFTRLTNIAKSAFFSVILDTTQRYFIEPYIEENVKGYPGYNAMIKEVDLILMAHHPLADHPIPFGPGIVSLAGTLCKDLDYDDFSADLRAFLYSGEFVYVSFGSHIKSIPQAEEDILIAAFSKLPYNIVWKSTSIIPDLPPNIRVFPWLPQISLLRHPNIKAFVSHGGYASKIDAFCGGVPLLVIPKIAPDQYEHADAISARRLGAAILDLGSSNSNELYEKVMNVSTDPEIRRNCATLQRQFLSTKLTDEQVLGYIDMAISGYKLLPGFQPFWEYFYLDIILFPILVIVGIRYLVKKIRRCLK